MANIKKKKEIDITKTGPQGYKELQNINNNTDDPVDLFIRESQNRILSAASQSDPYKEATQDVSTPLNNNGDYWGKSRYDSDNIINDAEFQSLGDVRAHNQPWYDKIANGAIKMLSTAGTTFLDGTVGALYGIGTGVSNLFDDNPDTGFWRGVWDNHFTNAMADFQESMEETFKNHRTEWEQNASVFDRIFSADGWANFWGDDILKNAGFTIGAAASIYATMGAGSLLKGINLIGKAGKALGLAKAGTEGLEATKFGKASAWLTNTFVSTQGEASIEALNATRDNRKLMEHNLEVRNQEIKKQLTAEYNNNIANGMSREEAMAIYYKKEKQLEADNKAYREQMERELTDAGNMIYAANIAALSLSNNLTLGSLIRGGFDTSKSLINQALKTSQGKVIEGVTDVGKALLKEDLKFAASEVKHKIAKTAGHWLLTSTQEGVEEGVQNLAAATGQISSQAEMNKYAREMKHKDNSKSMLGAMINPNVSEDLIDYTKALHRAFEENFGAANSKGWTEVAAGFISGALGVAGMHRNNEGKIRPTWQGGLVESWNTINGTHDAIQRQADLLNNALTSGKFGERAKHAVQQLAIKKAQDDALQRDDIQAFKNYEVQQFVNDAVFFRNAGMLDEYLAMFEAMSESISDTDVNELKALAKGEQGESSALDTMTNDQIKDVYKDKAKSTLDKIEQGLKSYEEIEKEYAEKFTPGTRQEAIMELSFYDTLIHDTDRRIDEIQGDINNLEAKDNLTPMEQTQLKQKKEAIDSLIKQRDEVSEKFEDYTKNTEKLQDSIEKRQTERQKIELYKQADKAIKKYKEAKTLQDIVDIYSHSPEENREQVLNKAVEQAEGETKTNLQHFKKYIGDVNAVEQLIEEKFPLDDANTAAINYQYKLIFNNILNNAVNEMLEDESPSLTRETLKEKLSEALSEFNEKLKDAQSRAGSIKMNEDETQYDFTEALENGEISEDDFIEDIDDKLQVTRSIKEGSLADKMVSALHEAKGFQHITDNIQYLIDSLDKLDELRKAGKKSKKKSDDKIETKPVEKKSSKGTFTEEEISIEDISMEEGIEGTFNDENEEGKEEENNIGTGKKDDEKEENKEDKENKSEPAIPELLNNEESVNYSQVEKKGISDTTYHTIKKKNKNVEVDKKIKDALAKKLSHTDTAIEIQEENLEKAKTDKEKKEILKKIQDIISKNIIGNSTLERVEKIFAKHTSLMKPTVESKPSLGEHSNENQNVSEDTASLNGNQFSGYVKSELADGKMIPVTTQKNGNTPIQVLLKEKGFDIQHTIDTYLGKVVLRDSKKEEVKDKTPVHYLHNNEFPNIVFLGMKYSDVQDIMPRNKVDIVSTNEGNFVLIGTLGYESSREGTKEQFETISNILKSEHTEGGWYASSLTNRIKDITAGCRVKQTTEDSETKVRDLAEMLTPNNPRNPFNLTIDDIKWMVVEGTEIAPKEKTIPDEYFPAYTVKNKRPGQVYMYIPSANGTYIPVYMEPIFYMELDQTSPLNKEIERLTKILASHDSSMEDKKSAKVQLDNLLIFSSPNRIHLNDEQNKFDSNTLYVTKNGEVIKVLDYTKKTGTWEDLYELIKQLNPRVNLSINILTNNPSIYLKSGVLKTDIAMLGTVNSSFFVYPIKDDGDFRVNKLKEPSDKYIQGTTKNRVYLNGKYVYYDGYIFTDSSGNKIEDEDGLLKIAYDIKQGKYKPIKYSNGTYYDVDGVMYSDNGHNGLSIISEDLRKKVINASSKNENKNKRTANIKKKDKEEDKKEEKESIEEKSVDIKEREDNLEKAITLAEEAIDVSSDINELNGIISMLQESIDDAEGYITLPGDVRIKKDSYFPIENQGLIILAKAKLDIIENKIKRINNNSNTSTNTETNTVQDNQQNTQSGNNNFVNGTQIDSLKSQEELENSKESSTFASVLGKRENADKSDEIYDLVSEKFEIEADNDNELISILTKHNIDLSSNDIDTVIEILKNCR